MSARTIFRALLRNRQHEPDMAPLQSPQEAAYPVSMTPEAWLERLGPQRFDIMRQGGTERACSSPLDSEDRKGIYGCAGCGQALFDSEAKYSSGTGWPSFHTCLPNSLDIRREATVLLLVIKVEQTEVRCSRCGSHLGHVFNDGPDPTGLRYCINGLAVEFKPA